MMAEGEPGQFPARESAQASGVIGLEALGEKVVFRLQRPRHAVEVKVGAEERREPGEVGGEERANGDGVAGVVLRAQAKGAM
jgi:hypothetical protein